MRFLCKHGYLSLMVAFSVLFSGWLTIGPAPVLTIASAQAENQVPPTPAKQPRLVFPEIKHDFGSVMEGVEIKYDFIIENKGDAPLVIHNVRPG